MINPAQPDYANTPASDSRPGFGYALADESARPLVTILTPFFNTAREIFEETARSIFRQSFQQWEWLIVNDASTNPESLAVLDEYRRRGDRRIRIIDHPENQGLPGTRNTGFDAATTEYVLLLDDDDLIEPTAIEKMYWLLETNPQYSVVNGWEVGFGAKEYLWNKGFDAGDEILEGNCTTGRAMVRRSAHYQIGGQDASIRGGMEDWEYWLRMASQGLWGHTIPEYLDWYRNRPRHKSRWENLDDGEKQRAFRERMREKFSRLYAGDFPRIEPRRHTAYASIREPARHVNRLAKTKRRLLLIIPHMTVGGADKFNIDFVAQLCKHEWEVTVAAVRPGDNSWMPQLSRYTPDLFVLPRFVHPTDQPAFLAHLIDSRQPDVVMVSGSELGYLLLPYLRSVCPEPAYVDLCHSEAPLWKNGGYARYSAAYQEALDLNIAVSQYLKEWIAKRGADANRIDVLHINVDADHWKPCSATRARVRQELNIPEDRSVIVFAGRLHDDKQPKVLAGVLSALRQQGLDFSAAIAGDGPELNWFKEFVSAHGLQDRVYLPGAVSPERVRDLMAAGDIFFLPSLWEGIALSIYEAMACGLAIVGADVGGQKELVTPECGMLLPRGDGRTETMAYQKALAGLISDKSRCREMGQKGRNRILRQFTLDEMGRRAVQLLEKAVQLHQTAPREALPARFARESGVLAVEFTRVDMMLDRAWQEGRVTEDEHMDLPKKFRELHAWTETLNARFNEVSYQKQQADERLAALTGTATGKLFMLMLRVRFAVFPRGSRRERFAKWWLNKLRKFRHHARQGPRALILATLRWMKRVISPVSAARPMKRPRRTRRPETGQVEFGGIEPALVSVILPVYNQAALLGDSIESVLGQTYSNFELIVLNDGSTDDVERVLDGYAGHPKIRILSQPNQQLPKALSNAFEFATGEFWTWTSADNLMEPTQLEKQIAFLQQHPDAAMVYCDYLAIDDRGQPLRDPNFRPHNRRPPDSPEIHIPRNTETLNTVEDNFIGACFMYRGWVGRLMGEYAPGMGVEDYDYWMRINDLFEIRHIGTDELLYRYRVHDNTLNARAGEHRIHERVQRLMALEEKRAEFFRRPWTIYVDARTRQWLEREAAKDFTIRDLPADGAFPSAEKTLILLHSDSIPRMNDLSRPAKACVACWFSEEPLAPYRFRAEIARHVNICFGAENETASRLAQFTPNAFKAAPGPGLLAVATAFADNFLFYGETTPSEQRVRRLPDVYVQPGRKYRALLQIDNFVQGGLEQVVIDVAEVLDRRRYDTTTLVLGRAGPAADQARKAGLRILSLGGGPREAAYRAMLTEGKYDLINAHYSHFGAAIADELKIPFIQTIHNTYVWLSADEIAAFSAADAYTRGYICVSNNVACYSDVRLGLSPDKLLVVPNGIEIERMRQTIDRIDRRAERRALGFGDDDFVVLNTASILPPKSQLFLVRALVKARATNPHIKLALLGRVMDERYHQRVQDEISRLGVRSAVHFLGAHSDSYKFYAVADAFALPSFWEGWSLALAEALAAGLPVIATDVGAASEVLDEAGGVLLQPPFQHITDLDIDTLYAHLDAENPEFVSQIAAALSSVADGGVKPNTSLEFLRRIDRRNAYQAYGRIFDWIIAGGSPAAARPWLRESRQFVEDTTAAHDPLAREPRLLKVESPIKRPVALR